MTFFLLTSKVMNIFYHTLYTFLRISDCQLVHCSILVIYNYEEMEIFSFFLFVKFDILINSVAIKFLTSHLVIIYRNITISFIPIVNNPFVFRKTRNVINFDVVRCITFRKIYILFLFNLFVLHK